MRIAQFWIAFALPIAAASAGTGHCQARAAQPTSAAVDQQALAGINRFSLDLYKRAATRAGNLFFSPANVSTAVGLANRGAKGATAAELRTVLHFLAGPRDYLATDAALLKTLNLTGEGRELHAANALWVQQGLALNADFTADIAAFAKGQLQEVDFKHDPEAARGAINHWVAAATHNRISQLLHGGDVDDQTRLTLVSSLYWKGAWAKQFNPVATAPEPFASIDGSTVPTPLMHQRARFKTAEHDGVKAIQLPYVGGEVAMVMLLPDTPQAYPHFEQALTSETLDRWTRDLDEAAPRDTELTMPKMHLQWRGDLVAALEAMGASTAFSNHADFSGITTKRYDGDSVAGLKIGKVIHQSWLDVDENGSEAAAATAVIMMPTASAFRGPEAPPFIFRADKPFLFMLRDLRTNLILFIGRYVGAPRF